MTRLETTYTYPRFTLSQWMDFSFKAPRVNTNTWFLGRIFANSFSRKAGAIREKGKRKKRLKSSAVCIALLLSLLNGVALPFRHLMLPIAASPGQATNQPHCEERKLDTEGCRVQPVRRRFRWCGRCLRCLYRHRPRRLRRPGLPVQHLP